MNRMLLGVLFWFIGSGTLLAQQNPPVATPSQEPAPSELTMPSRLGIALVIGNSRYAQGELPSVVTDRDTMTKALQSIGFKVREVPDLERPRDFQAELRTVLRDENAASEDILLVYYSGHGLQIEGKPYLLGTGIKGTGDMSTALRDYSEPVDEIIRAMEEAAPSARVLIVDACRNNAFATAPRRAGLAFQRAVEDTYILFADEPGKTVPARSEATRQSPFTAGLLFALENSSEGLERRFEIARDKTRELNPDQTPQLLKSDSSANRNRAFLDYGGRATPTHSAGQMLNDAEELYKAGSWLEFHAKIQAAHVLSTDAALSARLDRELRFSEAVIAARTAEVHEAGPRWADAAVSWQRAGDVFPARAWVFEKAILAWLLADRVREAGELLVRLSAQTGSPAAERATQMLTQLLKVDPTLDAAVKAASGAATKASGEPEFERYVVRR